MRRVHILAMCSSLVLALAMPVRVQAEDSPVVLSPAEEYLAHQIGFDKDVLLLSKDLARSPLHRLHGYDEEEYQIMANGIVLSVPRSRSDKVLWELRDRLKPRKYMAFLIEVNSALKTDKIGVIRGADPFEMLRIMHTNGDDDDVSHEDIVAKLRQWGKRCRFEIIGVENDWVEIEFRLLPRDLRSFAEEVYELSPDTVDDGAGSIDGLVKEIKATGRLTMSWE